MSEIDTLGKLFEGIDMSEKEVCFLGCTREATKEISEKLNLKPEQILKGDDMNE